MVYTLIFNRQVKKSLTFFAYPSPSPLKTGLSLAFATLSPSYNGFTGTV
jgi:hypothetical protein